jgi:hypothetical protein
MKEVLQTHFSEALITETTFPTLDGSSKEMATLKVKMQPEAVEFANGSNNRVHASSRHHERQKLWPASAFAFELHNVDVRHTTKIDSFTVKQGIKSYSTGRARFPHWEPTKLTFPDLSIYVPLAYADSLLDWYQRSMKGGKDPVPGAQQEGHRLRDRPVPRRHQGRDDRQVGAAGPGQEGQGRPLRQPHGPGPAGRAGDAGLSYRSASTYRS